MHIKVSWFYWIITIAFAEDSSLEKGKITSSIFTSTTCSPHTKLPKRKNYHLRSWKYKYLGEHSGEEEAKLLFFSPSYAVPGVCKKPLCST